RINYRTIIGNAGTRYSPTQKKAGELIGSFLVELAESDIAREFSSSDYDALLVILANNATMEAEAQIINWADRVLNLALVELLELWRWQAIVNAKIEARGDNKFAEDISY